MKQRFLGLIAATALALPLLVIPAPASADHSWGDYHWARTSNSSFNVKLGDNVSSAWDSYLRTASSDWSESSVLNTEVVAGGTTAKRCRPTAGRVEVCSERYGNNGWLGLAQIWISSSHITQGVVKMNDTYFRTSTYNTPAWRNLVMCQEVGHTFGLGHVDENFYNQPSGTCMDYSNDPEPNQHPNAHDYDQLEQIYSHTDGSTTVGQTTTSGRGNSRAADDDEAGNEPSAWGSVAGRQADGRPNLYVKNLNGGRKLFTHVFWIRQNAGQGRSD